MAVNRGYGRCCDGVNKGTHQGQGVSTGGGIAGALLQCRVCPTVGDARGERRGVTIVSLMKDSMVCLPGITLTCSLPKLWTAGVTVRGGAKGRPFRVSPSARGFIPVPRAGAVSRVVARG